MTLAIALLLERLFGDPQSPWHPVALFGRWAAWLESRLYRDTVMHGSLVWLVAVTPPLLLALAGHQLFGWVFDALLLWFSIGWRSLFEHVGRVLQAQHEDEARSAVAMIVSRDSATMSHEDARRAALESLAENASDAVIAPLFWFLLLGAPGAVLYRMINTLDAMWGYRTPQYLHFGRCSARCDDIANWLPARITAGLLLISGKPAAWQAVKAQARTHASPNAGWPEAALAHAARVRLGGPVMRAGVVDERPDYGPEHACDANHESAIYAREVVQRTLLIAASLTIGIDLVL